MNGGWTHLGHCRAGVVRIDTWQAVARNWRRIRGHLMLPRTKAAALPKAQTPLRSSHKCKRRHWTCSILQVFPCTGTRRTEYAAIRPAVMSCCRLMKKGVCFRGAGQPKGRRTSMRSGRRSMADLSRRRPQDRPKREVRWSGTIQNSSSRIASPWMFAATSKSTAR